jgi:hypothetical protein
MMTGFSIVVQGRSSAVFPYTNPFLVPPPNIRIEPAAVKCRCMP